MGNKAWVEDMHWKGKKAFNEAPTLSFVLPDGTVAGEGKVAQMSATKGRLTFLRLYEAGHLAPMDQPQATLYMLNKFVTNGKW